MKPQGLHQNEISDSQEDTIMTKKEKALALINTFATGDTEKAKELLAS